MSILTLTKSMLNISDTSLDTILSGYIAVAKKTFFKATNYYLGDTETITDYIYFDGSCTDNINFYEGKNTTEVRISYSSNNDKANVSRVYLATNYASITSIYTDTTEVSTSNYLYDSSTYIITFIDETNNYVKVQSFTYNMKITGTRGFDQESDIPSDIQTILALITCHIFNTLGGNQYKNPNDESSLLPSQMILPKQIEYMMDMYKIGV